MNPNLPLDHLVTEARNPASANLDELTSLELVRLMNAEDANVIPAVAAQAEAIARAIEVIADRLRAGGRLIYVGAGTSGRLGVLDATECPPTFNSPPGQVVGVIAGGYEALTRAVEGAEDHPEFAARDLAALNLQAADVMVGIATSGRTPYVLGAITYARTVGIFTIGLSCNPASDLDTAAELAITVTVGPEVLSGSTRLKAGTATKLVLNMLSTGAMVRLGKTYGNLMVDLRATNNKLRARINRIVRQLTGLDEHGADELLRQCDGELKTALVSNLAALSVEQSRARLATAGGRVGAVIRQVRPGPIPALERGPMQQGLLLGIDGGGSKTVALLGRRTEAVADANLYLPLGRGEAGSSNLHSAGRDAALAALDTAVNRAFAAAGLVRQSVAAACLGLAGAGRPDDQALILDWAKQVGLAAQTEVTSDVSLLVEAGTPDGWGLALVAGTGSIAWGRAPDGATTRAGGWGHLLGDEGSGYALALAGLQAVVRAADGRGPATALTPVLLSALGVKEPKQLIAEIYGSRWDRARLAALAPLVLRAAVEPPFEHPHDHPDELAVRIVADAVDALATMAAAVMRQFHWQDQPIPVVLAGGALLAEAPLDFYREQVLNAMRARGVLADPVCLVLEPARGALRRAASLTCHTS
jgi:N-acetylmuramic acid 6-phosphate etherase